VRRKRKLEPAKSFAQNGPYRRDIMMCCSTMT
jgi:hypothetical protein